MNAFKGLSHIALAVTEPQLYEKAIAFYERTLNMPLIRQWANPPKHITMLDMGNCMLEIILGATGKNEGAFPHIAFEVEKPDDVDFMLVACQAAGCKITRPACNLDKNEDIPGKERGNAQGKPYRLRNGFCLGPVGETLEFFCQR